jgi:uncharacterized membrane protein YkgB
MATHVQTLPAGKNTFEKLGAFLIRYGLVLVLAWIGAMKFTTYEAEGIKTLVETSPFMSWMYKVLSLQATSNEKSRRLPCPLWIGWIFAERHGATWGCILHPWRFIERKAGDVLI